ncbi:putative bifunctional diguanylate cyclase/phosphodiesterase [Falsigemmobacter faecalis]|uniref:EAL domain-containing protein n=1 Tax=Falsigemmobacter faecalis TaxID=2488730 RepID=A0A3P3D342_9RHOB|nr:EAL domain-containing protein [Falsigemmobacter faecalis]RRH68843.1 EAL domain-containing protein [Falsigemmobacter faecalis]
MQSDPLRQIFHDSDVVLRAQFNGLRRQIPLMYALMTVNITFLTIATFDVVPRLHSLGGGLLLGLMSGIRAVIWLRRSRAEPVDIQRYLKTSVVVAAGISAVFGAWCYLLLTGVDPPRQPAIALYVFVGVISCCYCLQALPIAGWFVLIFGSVPVTAHLLTSGEWYLIGTGVMFICASVVIIHSLKTSYQTFADLLYSREEMHGLIEALQQSQEHYRASVELNPQIPWIADPTGALTELSPRWARLTGRPLSEGLGWGWLSALHPDDAVMARGGWEYVISVGGETRGDTRYRIRLADGSYRWFRARVSARRAPDGSVTAWYGNLEDIHEQVAAERRLQESEERYRLASLATNDIIWDLTFATNHILWNSAATAVLGYPADKEGVSVSWWMEKVHPDDREKLMDELTEILKTRQSLWASEFRGRAMSGEYRSLASRAYVVRNEEGKAIRLIGSLQDVTGQKEYEAGLYQSAHHDFLTGLANRAKFNQELQSALLKAEPQQSRVLLLVLDVDRFKGVNDGWGHDAGDTLLRELARRLQRSAPAAATVARLGGDEFALILPDPDGNGPPEDFVDDLIAALSQPVRFNGRQIGVSLSAGAAVAFTDGTTAEELHKSADLALYAAKKPGPGHIRFFEDGIRDEAMRETQMLSDARAALQDDSIVPFYQPKICLRSGAPSGFEALLRWQHPEGVRPPSAISAALADPALSVQLTNRMLDCVIADIVRWRAMGLQVGRIAVNGASGDFLRGDFAERILTRLAQAGLPPSVLEVEVTETVFLSQKARNVEEILQKLSRAGITIALDDFGTGYASLTHLKQFPVDTIKIDRSFISRLGGPGSEDSVIVDAVCELARKLGITTVAEGIETAIQASLLKARGCDVGQGYFFGHPVPASEVPELLKSGGPAAESGIFD